jgi:hypothetical protein
MVGDERPPAASPLPRGGRGSLLDALPHYDSLPTGLRDELRRNVQRLYEEHARLLVATGHDPHARAAACWDEVEIHPDERAPHGAFFTRRPMSRAHAAQPVPRAPVALRPASSFVPRRPV